MIMITVVIFIPRPVTDVSYHRQREQKHIASIFSGYLSRSHSLLHAILYHLFKRNEHASCRKIGVTHIRALQTIIVVVVIVVVLFLLIVGVSYIRCVQNHRYHHHRCRHPPSPSHRRLHRCHCRRPPPPSYRRPHRCHCRRRHSLC